MLNNIWKDSIVFAFRRGFPPSLVGAAQIYAEVRGGKRLCKSPLPTLLPFQSKFPITKTRVPLKGARKIRTPMNDQLEMFSSAELQPAEVRVWVQVFGAVDIDTVHPPVAGLPVLQASFPFDAVEMPARYYSSHVISVLTSIQTSTRVADSRSHFGSTRFSSLFHCSRHARPSNRHFDFKILSQQMSWPVCLGKRRNEIKKSERNHVRVFKSLAGEHI